ncbi:hypothetical protein JCM3765_003381 [Sporobolomyces pararoseus]
MLSTLTRTRGLQPSTVAKSFRPITSSLNSSSSLRHLSSPSLSPSPALGLPLNRAPSILLSTTLPSPPNPFRFQSRFNSSSSSSSSSSSPPPPPPPEAPPNLSLTARLKLLFKTHGWTALTLYLFLSFIDFSLTFLLVWSIGADRVREFEDWVLMHLGWRRRADGEKGVLRKKVEEWKENHSVGNKNKLEPVQEVREARDGVPVEVGTSALATEGKKSAYSAYATTAVLAYAIHKTALLPVRVGITVWATPKVVRALRSWGWNVGQMPATAAVAAQAAARKVKT